MDKLTKVQPNQNTQPVQKPDPAKIMYDALVKIAHSDAFFDGEKRLVEIARKAIKEVTRVNK